MDTQNGTNASVSFCNRVFQSEEKKWIRQGAVFYFRRSIDEYERRRKLHGDYLTHVRRCLEDGLKDRWRQSVMATIALKKIQIAEGLEAYKTKCNCDVESYYQPFVSCCYRLGNGFGLNARQITSVLLAMSQSACSAGYTLAATEIILSTIRTKKVDIGFLLISVIKKLDLGKGQKIYTPLRFSKYKYFDVKKERTWLRHVK